jgi:hypothetical protein
VFLGVMGVQMYLNPINRAIDTSAGHFFRVSRESYQLGVMTPERCVSEVSRRAARSRGVGARERRAQTLGARSAHQA